jgi:hypothetical protein
MNYTSKDVQNDVFRVSTGYSVAAYRGGCSLRRDGDWYVMSTAPIFDRDGSITVGPSHRLAVSETSEERIAAHWSGYLENNGARITILTRRYAV